MSSFRDSHPFGGSVANGPRFVVYRESPAVDLIESLRGSVAENLALLTPVERAWQPSNLLPDLAAEDWAVERTIHHLLGNGFDPWNRGDAGAGLIDAAFQERATRITHANVARLAASQGDEGLTRICRKIADDEARHETFYTRVVGQIMEREPEAGILAFRSMVKGITSMPGRHMFDGRDPDLFDHFAAVSQRLGTYTIVMYAQIIEHLVGVWGVARQCLSGKAARAQDYLCRQAEKYRRFAGKIEADPAKQPRVRFTWLPGCEV